MASGGTRVACGSVAGTGADLNVDSVGFKPRTVKLYNVTGLVTAEWTETMADDSAVKRVTAGDMTFVTSNGITPRSAGFAIGADTDINVAAEVIHWEAHE